MIMAVPASPTPNTGNSNFDYSEFGLKLGEPHIPEGDPGPPEIYSVYGGKSSASRSGGSEAALPGWDIRLDDGFLGINTGYEGYVLQHEQLLAVVDIAVVVLTLIGNILAVYFLCGSKKARTTHNITIVSMAVANCIIAGFVTPTYIAISKYEAMSNSVTPFLCRLNKYIWYWCKTVNVYSVLAMVVDRYFKVMKPHKSSYLSSRCMFFLNFVWFFGAAYNIWEIVLNTTAHIFLVIGDAGSGTVGNTDSGAIHNVTVRRCIPNYSFTHLQNAFLAADLIVIYIVPFVTIACLSIAMARRIYMYRHGGAHLRSCPLAAAPSLGAMAQPPYSGGEWRVGNTWRRDCDSDEKPPGWRQLCMALLLTLVFYVCQLPLEVAQPAIYFTYDFTRRSLSTIKLLESLSFLNGLLNVAVYAACSAQFHAVIRGWWRARGSTEDQEEGVGGPAERPEMLLRACSTETGLPLTSAENSLSRMGTVNSALLGACNVEDTVEIIPDL